ncbi:hypothetical protein SAMN05428953_12671 [Mesorhizobium muleiense]|uniref:Uncharacterized protein n=1 Tax=Mesorhizobium muleiense TaxID=1004279 RepID=A0A1G9H529_9HYPH|nr:hypothetical protein [Mesorhizobium muleiense]SDL08047.1 hypothetical protein SAMN05428953_12671 [Mesorhizobium muleiense]
MSADQIIGQIEERFPNWRSYRDLIDCIDCTLAELRRVKEEQSRWTNVIAVTAPGLFPQDYVFRSPCDPPLPKPDVLYIDGAVYRREIAQ